MRKMCFVPAWEFIPGASATDLHTCVETGTDCMDGLQAMVRDHEGDARWGAHAQAIVHGNMWKPPGNGGHDDKVTLPCHNSCFACTQSAQHTAC